MVPRPSLLRLLAAGADAEQAVEVEVAAMAVEGKTLAALALHGNVAVVLRCGRSLVVPNGSTVLRAGDVLTLLGSGEPIASARTVFDSRSPCMNFTDARVLKRP